MNDFIKNTIKANKKVITVCGGIMTTGVIGGFIYRKRMCKKLVHEFDNVKAQVMKDASIAIFESYNNSIDATIEDLQNRLEFADEFDISEEIKTEMRMSIIELATTQYKLGQLRTMLD